MKLARGLIVFFFLAGTAFPAAGQSRPLAKAGVLDARAWNFQKHRLPLNGYWKIFNSALISPGESLPHSGSDYFFPSTWNSARSDDSGQGFATFFLKILVPDTSQAWSVDVPPLYSSCKLWINGEEVIAVGRVDSVKERCRPQWIFKQGAFRTSADTLQIILQIANFHHDKGGIKDPIYLGIASMAESTGSWTLRSDLVESGVLLLLGLTFLIFFVFQRKAVILYFALLCLTWSVRSVFSGLYPITHFDPDFDWFLLVRIEYGTLFLGVIWAALFLSDLFSAFSSKGFTYVLVGINVLFILFASVTTPLVFTPWVTLYLAVAAIVVVYAIILVVRALLSEQAGAWFLLASIITGIVIFGYDIVAYQLSFYNFVFLNIGYLVIFLLTAVALLFQVEVFKSRYQKRNVLTYKDMFGDR
jgi:hypothetical protein